LNDADSSVTSKQVELTRLKEELREEESDPAAEYELDRTARVPAVLCVVAVGDVNRFD